MNDQRISMLVDGIDMHLPDAAKRTLEHNIGMVSKELDLIRTNRQAGLQSKKTDHKPQVTSNRDTELFTTISEMINGGTRDFAGFGTMLDNLYAKNKKYFSILKDYEVMPILIPQINRVLNFLVNECLSPDIQNDHTFVIRYTGEDKTNSIQEDIDQIKKEMKLDSLLRDVYMNRYKLGREYYMVQDYNATFDHMLQMLQRKRMNESTVGMNDSEFFKAIYGSLTETINTVGGTVRFQQVVNESAAGPNIGRQHDYIISEASLPMELTDLNIIIERSSVVDQFKAVEGLALSESYSRYSAREVMSRMSKGILTGTTGIMNEDIVQTQDNTRLEQLIMKLKQKKLQRCTIIRFDPAKIFRLKVGGKVIGFFHISDVNEGASNIVNFSQSLKDQLMKSRATNLSVATQSAEEVITKELAKRIIDTFDPNLGISRVEDIDLLHDFIRNNEIYRGNKRITFYYADEIYDMTRSDDSILTNAVFFTKLYAVLLMNNIVTKVIRGRGRQIHTVKMGASDNVQRYIDNAMAALAMPEHNLGALHGSFEQIMNPFNGSSDIIIPTNDDSERYITTDYIPGQDVDMNDDFLRMLLNSIVTSFNLDSATLDATNGNLQFARTLTMESLQISNSIKNEQQDVHDPWESMCLGVLTIMGSDATKHAVEQGQVEVKFFEPKSLIIQNVIEDLNNSKNLAEAIADIIPQFNEDGAEVKRSKFIFAMVRENTNYDFGQIQEILKEAEITVVDDSMLTQIRQLIRDYAENTKEVQYGDFDGDGMASEGEGEGAEGFDEMNAEVDSESDDDFM